MMWKAAFLASLVLLSGCGAGGEPPQVQVLDAWCRPVPAGVRTAACYVTLTANVNDRLLAVSTPAAERVEIHTTVMDGDVMRMVKLDDGLRLPRNQAVALRTGGDHLMLFGPGRAFVEGQTISLTLTFDQAQPAVIEASIRRSALEP